MLYVSCVLGVPLPVLYPTTPLLKYAHKVVWSIILAHINGLISCSHPIPEFVVVKLLLRVAIIPRVSVWGVTIDNISFSELIVSVVHFGKLHLRQIHAILELAQPIEVL